MTDGRTCEDASRARDYERGSLWLRLVSTVVGVAVLIAVLASGLSVWLRDGVRDITSSSWPQVALFSAVAFTAWSLVTFPWDYLTGFRREHRYALSNQTLSAWLLDQAKGFLVGLPISLLALELLYWLLRTAGNWWWVWAAGATTLLSIAFTSLGPVVFIPLFWKLERIDYPALTARLTTIAEREGARVIGVFRMGMAAKTRRANAMVAGLGRTQRIILGDTLMDGFEPDEIDAVVAHEVAHYKHQDLWKGIAVGAALPFVGFFVASRVLDALASRGGLDGPADIAALRLLLLSVGVYGLVTMPLANAYSRWRESLADRAALRATGLVEPFIAAMRRLASLTLANPEPHPLVERVFYSHPSIARRIAMAEGMRNADV